MERLMGRPMVPILYASLALFRIVKKPTLFMYASGEPAYEEEASPSEESVYEDEAPLMTKLLRARRPTEPCKFTHIVLL